MNKKVSKKRLSWTVPALNHTLQLQDSIIRMGKEKKESQSSFVKGTLNEASRICGIIHQKLGDSEVTKKFKGDFWYLEEQSTLKKLIILSKQCEKTYFDILKYFSKNQSF